MTDQLASTFASCAILLVGGSAIGLLDRAKFHWRWLIAAVAMLIVNDALLTNMFGLLPDLAAASDWNWQGKLLALGASLAIAAYPALGFARSGITLRQNVAGWPVTYAVAAVLGGVFAALALALPADPADADTLAFQLTMPGLEEEIFYRGILLLALNEAFRGRWHFLGIDWGWGALLSSLMFGLGHALDVGSDGVNFDALAMAVTGGPALLLVWLRERTGSLFLPVIMHNYANSISHFI